MSRHPFLAVASVLSLACLALLLPGQVTSLNSKFSAANSGQNQHPGQVKPQLVQPTIVKYKKSDFQDKFLIGAIYGLYSVGLWTLTKGAIWMYQDKFREALEKEIKANQTVEAQIAHLGPVTSATGSSRTIILILMFSIAGLLFVSFCVGGIYFWRSGGKNPKPADGGQAEASSSKTTSTTISTTAK